MPNEKHRITLSPEELEALKGEPPLQTDASLSPFAVDSWFKYRNAYLLTVISLYVIKLLFFAETTVSNFVLHADELQDLILYMHVRALFVIAWTCFYLWSYLKNWKFEKIALIFAAISVTSFAMDYFNAYVYLHESALPLVSWLLGLRLLAVVCLVLNALNCHRAPLMPRTLAS